MTGGTGMGTEERLAELIARQYGKSGYGRFLFTAEVDDIWQGRMYVTLGGRCSEDGGCAFVAVDTCIPCTRDGEGNLTTDNTVRFDTLHMAMRAEKYIQDL